MTLEQYIGILCFIILAPLLTGYAVIKIVPIILDFIGKLFDALRK